MASFLDLKKGERSEKVSQIEGFLSIAFVYVKVKLVAYKTRVTPGFLPESAFDITSGVNGHPDCYIGPGAVCVFFLVSCIMRKYFCLLRIF